MILRWACLGAAKYSSSICLSSAFHRQPNSCLYNSVTPKYSLERCFDDASSCSTPLRYSTMSTTGTRKSPSSAKEESSSSDISTQIYCPWRLNDIKENELSSAKKNPIYSWRQLPKFYVELSKPRLSCLVVLTTMAAYAMAPGISSISTLLWTTMGTSLCSVSANTFNQILEVPYDAQMQRTRERVLVRGALSVKHAFLFGLSVGTLGVACLFTQVNSLAAILCGGNILLYAGLYTPLKRISILNTWVGAVVGAIPPVAGYVACTGSIDMRAILLGGILYAWQFPHFNSLSWLLRHDYAAAKYKMMSVVAPALNAQISLKYAVLLWPICIMAPFLDMTTPLFIYDASLLCVLQIWQAISFYRSPCDHTARKLFYMSLLFIPVIFALMLIHKKNEDIPEPTVGNFST